MFERAVKAEDLDPLEPRYKSGTVWSLLLRGRYEEAEKKCLEYQRLSEDRPGGHNLLARVYLATARLDKALEETIELERLAGWSFDRGHAGYLFGALGKTEEANRILKELKHPSQGLIIPFAIALVHLGLRENDQALKWLEKAYDEHSAYFGAAWQLPEIQSLGPDPRFKQLEAKLGIKSYVATRKESGLQ